MVVVAVAGLAVVAVALLSVVAARHFLETDARFRIESSAAIQTVGNTELSRADLLSVFGSDLGRDIFYVPLAQRRAELEQLPWVEHATVMRVLPNQLRVAVVERTPIAFVQVNGEIELADAAGVVLAMSPAEMAARHYAFPVVDGINPGDPLSVRGARMQIYQRFIHELDASGQNNSSQISEVDLSDPEDLRATVPSGATDLVLLFGSEDFLSRWHNYQAHIAQWRGQYPNLASVDLRYEHEVVLKMAKTPAQAADPGPAGATAPQKPAAHATPHPTHAHTHKAHLPHHPRGAR